MKTLKESILRRPEKGRVAVEQIIMDWLKANTKIVGNYTINNDLTIDVKGTLTITNKSIKEIPSIINFNKVSGYFDISDCSELVSLRGCPTYVGLFFTCNNCTDLKSLKGAPDEVGSYFSCMNCNELTSLEGAPKKVGEFFRCTFCSNLVDLKGAPEEVGGNFDCSFCKRLTSLKGCPKRVKNIFQCFDCGRQFTKDEVKNLCRVKEYIIC